MTFILKPYVEVGPIKFGMSESDLISIIGPPIKILTNRRGEPDYLYSDFSIRFSSDERKIVEVGFLPTADFYVDGIDVFRDTTAFYRLVQSDGYPYEYVGFIVLFRFGLTLTGFHDNDKSQKAATAFEKGRWEHLKPKLKPFKI